MPQLPVHDRVEEILKLDLVPRMKAHGFRKRKGGFARDAKTTGAVSGAKAVQVCEIDVGGSQSSHEGVVGATLAVFFPDFMPILTPWQTKMPAQVKAIDGQARVPLGELGPWKDPHHSWRIDANAQDQTIAKELADAIDQYGLPFLDDMLDMEKVAASELKGVTPELKVLALVKLGRKDQAKAAVEALLASKPKEYMAVASFAGRLKLPAPPRPAK
jgi:hypothetical protein